MFDPVLFSRFFTTSVTVCIIEILNAPRELQYDVTHAIMRFTHAFMTVTAQICIPQSLSGRGNPL